MKLRWTNCWSVVLVLVFSGTVMACDKDKKAAKEKSLAGATPCSKSKSVTLASAKEGDAKEENPQVQAILASMPAMKFRVGDTTTSCSKSAAKMAEESKTDIVYVVEDKTYENQADAVVALTVLLDEKAKELTKVQYSVGGKCSHCPMTAKSMAKKSGEPLAYSVGGVEFSGKERAEKVAEEIKEVADSILISYKVGDSRFCCDKMAGAKVKETGEPMTYVVGDEETSCPKTAQMLLTWAKIRAIIETAAGELSM